jgi:hypothetical protein
VKGKSQDCARRGGAGRRALVALAVAAATIAAAAPGWRERGDPASRIPDRNTVTEYWDLYARFDSGGHLFGRFVITNEGPGERSAAAIGHLVRADGKAIPFRNGRRQGRWKVSDDGRRIEIGSSVLDQSGPTHRFEFDSSKQGMKVHLRFEPVGPVTWSDGAGPAGYRSDLLQMGAPVEGTAWVSGMERAEPVKGTMAVTHTWVDRSESDLALRRIEFLSLRDGTALYLSDLTTPSGERWRWLAIRHQGEILYHSDHFDVEMGAPSPAVADPAYPHPELLRIHNTDLEATIQLGEAVLRHDLFEALPLPFRLLLSFKMRPHRLWIDSSFEVKLRAGPTHPHLDLRGSGITSVTFLNPLPSPA